MATAAGIDMSECRLHHEGGRSHFMTRRFDRDGRGRKLHMQSIGAMQHFDFNDPAGYASNVGVKAVRAKRTIEEVAEAVDRWRAFAEEAEVDPSDMSRIEKTFRMTLRGK